VLERQSKNFKLKHVIGDIGTAINKGRSLHDALADYPKVFSSVFIAMVHAGEESGNLPQALSMVGTQLERTYTMRRKVRGALMYPAVIMIAMGCIGILMMIYVVPTLAATFSEFGKELPLSTRFILAISGFLVNHTFSFVISLFVIVILFWRLTKLSFFSRIIQFVTLRLPVIGNLVKEVNSAVAARTMGSLISAGVDMVRAITIGKEVVQNVYYKEVLDKAAEGVVKGEPLSTVFTKEEKLFPPLVGEMIEVGEETGKLTEMLLNVAVFYEAEVEAATKNMSTIIEPFLMLIIGGAVGFFAIAMIQPIYSLTAAM
jgi:type IV pilus assembly protein PilC